ncbi:phosphoribosylglycinamide formyltransferase [Egibacter rhizosphaerae]|uniref:Phosphoribosylglycinamide formyltransferase n=1 Tax=Egibacter rhizosphaerae TaxID=1670831 RepID=A0A411YGZ9_9ACTN|nr:phosphoribosylglycinamide formyltransferase [Egibacter rhizosphaerae]QBI20605.1 phosphoribosylglycinamide formyltransferase [Egibacter rhizosphaerae]
MSSRLVVLASGSGSNLQALLDAPDLAPEIALVASDRAGATALERAARAGIATSCVPFRGSEDRDAWAEELGEAVAAAAPDLVVLAGFMRVLPPPFVRRWPMFNVHPSLLPAFPGARAVEAALEWGVKVSGATVHFVDEEVDHGPIVAQEAVPVTPDDDAASLHARIQTVEHRLLPAAVRLHAEGRLRSEGRRVHVVD